MQKIEDVEIFRAGTHRASSGQVMTISVEEVARIAASYNPEYHEAPVVVGHPADNQPAFGWVKGLKEVGGKLLASLEIVPEFVEAISKGLFRKRSASFYQNLEGKGMYLRHLAFLGAAPPAVKALADISLSDMAGGGAVALSFTEIDPGVEVSRLACEIMRTDNVPFGVALERVGWRHPELNSAFVAKLTSCRTDQRDNIPLP